MGALGLIAVAAAALAFLRFAPGPEGISVPAGARAGDLTLEPCTYPTEDGPYDADCGSLVVRESHGDPESTLIALPIIRVRARSSPPAEPVFFFEGGPGQTNLDFRYANRFARDHDFVFVGYRESTARCASVARRSSPH